MQVLNADKVRIKSRILEFLKAEVKAADPHSKMYVFGSRANLDKKGGDIDILILTNKRLTNDALKMIKTAFWREFGEQKLDLVNFTFEEDRPFKRIALLEAVEI